LTEEQKKNLWKWWWGPITKL